MENQNIVIGLFLISFGLHALAIYGAASAGLLPKPPPEVNWFALMMIALNVGAAFWGYYKDGLNQLVYGLAAAVINICVYFNFDKIIERFK